MLDIVKVTRDSCRVLEKERQSLWTIVKLSLSQQLDYWLQLCYPSNVRAAADTMDKIMYKMLGRTAASTIPRNQEQVTVISVPGLPQKSYQECVVRHPIRLGGFGLRSQADLSPAAFIGSVKQVLPSFVGARGICPQLGHLLGS